MYDVYDSFPPVRVVVATGEALFLASAVGWGGRSGGGHMKIQLCARAMYVTFLPRGQQG